MNYFSFYSDKRIREVKGDLQVCKSFAVMMKLFPTGAGLVAAFLGLGLLIAAIVYLKRDSKTVGSILSVLAAVCVLYCVLGAYVLFCPPFQEASAYFPSGISAQRVQAYLDRAESDLTPLDNLVPGAESYGTQNITYVDGTSCQAEYQSVITDSGSRVMVDVFTYAQESEAIAAFDAYAEALCSSYSEKYLTEQYGFLQTAYNGYTVYVFPIQYDGTPFFLPFADSDGASFAVLVQYGNQYVKIYESTERISLALPNMIFQPD